MVGGVVVIVLVFGGRGWEVVVVGGVGAGAVGASFALLAVAVTGVGASLPGAVVPDEFAFVGFVEGFGGGARVGGSHGSGGGPGSPLGRVVGCGRWGRRLDPWSQWCTSSLRARTAPARGADRVVGAPCGCWWPSRRCGGRYGPR